MATGSVSELAYISIRARDFTAALSDGVEVLGLHETESTGKKAYLTAQAKHHEVIYSKSDEDALDHIALVVTDRDELDAIREKVTDRGFRIVADQPLEDGMEEGFAFVAPEGYTYQVSTQVSSYTMSNDGGFGPDRLGHVNLQVQDSLATRDFLVDVLDFRVSDQIGHDAAFFLRCNSDHHGIAVFKGPRTGMHHYAWQTQGIYDLARLGDRLARREARLAWGPVRHGAGDNIAAYYVDPAGAVIELYTDLERIFDKERPARIWDDTDAYWYNQWDGQFPASFLDHGLPPIER